MTDSRNFKPGDLVCFVASPDLRMHIVERLEQTCPGGNQVHYTGRVHAVKAWGTDANVRDYVRVNAVEVMEIPKIDEVIAVLHLAKDKAMAVEAIAAAALIQVCLEKVNEVLLSTEEDG